MSSIHLYCVSLIIRIIKFDFAFRAGLVCNHMRCIYSKVEKIETNIICITGKTELSLNDAIPSNIIWQNRMASFYQFLYSHHHEIGVYECEPRRVYPSSKWIFVLSYTLWLGLYLLFTVMMRMRSNNKWHMERSGFSNV